MDKEALINKSDAVGLRANGFVVHSVALCILSAIVQEFKPIGAAHNRRAQPFVAAANIDDKRQVVSASYNSPIGLLFNQQHTRCASRAAAGAHSSSPQK